MKHCKGRGKHGGLLEVAVAVLRGKEKKKSRVNGLSFQQPTRDRRALIHE